MNCGFCKTVRLNLQFCGAAHRLHQQGRCAGLQSGRIPARSVVGVEHIRSKSMSLNLTVEDVMEPLAEELYDDPSKKRGFLDQDYMQVQADNTTVIEGIENVIVMIELALIDLVDPIMEARLERARSDLHEAHLKLSENFADSDAWLDVDFSDWVDGLDG